YVKTEVEAHLGTGCSGSIDPLIAPEQVVTMRQGFDWMNTSALAETDAQDLPVMRYALIYIETRQQYRDLQSSGIYFSQYPIFVSELERFRDKCGRITPPSDTRGMFLYSIMPAAVYNQLRTAAQAAIQSGQGTPPFPAVLLPQVPEPQFA